jgi:hypothetical protein
VIFEHNSQVASRSPHTTVDVMALLSDYGYTFSVVGDSRPGTRLIDLPGMNNTSKVDIIAMNKRRTSLS